MGKRAGQWIRLGFLWLAVAVVGGLAGCAARPRPVASILDECGHPTAANQAWGLSIQFPNAN